MTSSIWASGNGGCEGQNYLIFLDKVCQRDPRALAAGSDPVGRPVQGSRFYRAGRYRKQLPSFSDDIQGTGAVALAGLLAASRLKGEALRDQRIVILGAGAGGIGVAWAISQGLMREGLSREEARDRVCAGLAGPAGRRAQC